MSRVQEIAKTLPGYPAHCAQIHESFGYWPHGEEVSGVEPRFLDARWADLNGSNLMGADLRWADLRDADLRGADLRGADLSGANLRGADLRDADISGADLRGADLRDADISGADLRGADLRGADLRVAVLCDANLSKADLRDANLRGAYLMGVNLRYADLRGADLMGATLPDSPSIQNIDSRILACIYAGEGFDMRSWHGKCGTTHCRAGWAITLAGEEGAAMESEYGPSVAAALIYTASGSYPVPDWGASNEEAIADLRARAARN